MQAGPVQIPKTQPFKQIPQLNSISFQAGITPGKQIISLLELYPVSSIWEKKIFLWSKGFLQHYQDGYYERLFMKCNHVGMRGAQAYCMEILSELKAGLHLVEPVFKTSYIPWHIARVSKSTSSSLFQSSRSRTSIL